MALATTTSAALLVGDASVLSLTSTVAAFLLLWYFDKLDWYKLVSTFNLAGAMGLYIISS